MDIRTGKQLQQTFTRVEVLTAALESLTKALDAQEQRIKYLEDLLRQVDLRRQTTRNGRTSISL
jgi:hypothetical protein